MPDQRRAFRHAVARACPAAGDTRTVWRSLGGAGVLNQLGPHDVDPDQLGDLLAELDARLPVGTVLSVCVQVATVIPLLRAVAESPLAGKVLDEALHGEAIVALAATDAGVSGSALLDARTEVRDTGGGGVLLNGSKEWISNAGHCDYALVLARHRPARHFTSFSWLLVPADRPGVSYQPMADTLFASAGLGHLRFDDVQLGREHVVGRPGRAMAEFARQIGTERLAGALWARALCRRVLADTYHHLVHRSTGEGVLWDNAAIRERFARCLVELRRLVALCASPGSGAASDGMVLKAACAESVERILGECVSLRGAEAFRDGGVASLRAQAAMFGIAGGATGAMLAGIADHADDLLRSVG